MKTLLVWNGHAGARDADRLALVSTRLAAGLAMEVHELVEGESATEIAKAAIARGASVIIAAGGDGTVSGCASATMGTEATLGILPCGTSNSISRALGLPTDLELACDAILSGATRCVDVGRIHQGGQEDRAMVLLASIGFHADTISSTSSENKTAIGKLAYVMRGVQHLGEFESFRVELETERGQASVSAMALTIANLAPPETLFAQGSPEVSPVDGLLDLTLVTADTALDAIAAGLELVASALSSSSAAGPHVRWARCTRVRVTAEPPQLLLIDGDAIGTTPMEVEIVPGGLRIACPPPA